MALEAGGQKRKILSISGTRSDYGLMTPVFSRITQDDDLEFELIVTGMHLLPEFESSLAQIREDAFGVLHLTSMLDGEDSGQTMAQSLGLAIINIAELLSARKPDLLLLQGDRGEMLAGAIAAAHMNIPIVHMSGGDRTGSIDDSIRNAISKFSHLHLTTCAESSKRLLAMEESPFRIIEVGEPGLDLIAQLKYIDPAELAGELGLDLSRSIILAAQHPVTTESEQAAWQMRQTLEALEQLAMQVVCTYPNSDSGGREMTQVLESFRGKPFLRIVPNLGSRKYLSLLRVTSVLVGNSSSGIFEAPSFKLPAINIGTRQYGRLRACNVIDVGHQQEEIIGAIEQALHDEAFRRELSGCKNPYGDGRAAERTVHVLKSLRLVPPLLSKWMETSEPLVEKFPDGL